MASDSEYSTLLSKYNRLVARCRDLTTQIEEKEAKWHELESSYKANESITRDLCELILAKDPKEMVLGQEYAWGKIPFRDLLAKTKLSFERYNAERTKLLQDIQQQSEQRRSTAESLQVQIEQLLRERKELDALRSGAQTVNDDTGEIVDTPPATEPGHSSPVISTQVQASTPVQTVPEETMRRVNYKTQQAARAGDVILVESDEDVSQKDLEQQAVAARMSTAISVEQQGIKISPSQKKRKLMNTVKANEEQLLVQVDINDVVNKMTPRRWYVMEVIGTTGLCEGTELIQYSEQNYPNKKTDTFTKAGITYELQQLVSCGFLIQDKTVNHPLKPHFAIYYMSVIGRRVYLEHFGKDPVPSERDILIAQHDNYDHGVGIKSLKDILEKSQNFDTVCMDRKENTIQLNGGAKYIPDIKVTGKTAKGNRPFTAYFEYEHGTHSQNDFETKLNRMSKVTRFLNIVCPNQDAVNICAKKVQKWIEDRGGHTKVGTLTVRLTPLSRLKDSTNINNDDNWMVIFRCPESATPIFQ